MTPEPRRPPRWAELLLGSVVPPGDRDAVLGDLEETFLGAHEPAPRFPRLWYGWQAVAFTAAYAWEGARRRTRRQTDAASRGITQDLGEAIMVEGWVREIRFAARALRKVPGFVVATVGTLGLGIGATTAIFSVIDGALLRPLPYPEPDRLVFLSESWRESTTPGGSSMNPANFADLQAAVRTIEGMSPYAFASANLTGGDAPQRVTGLRVGHEFLSTLGVRPVMGRGFTEEEGSVGGPDVAVLTFELWRDLFGSDPGILGRDVVLDQTPHTIVGVLAPGIEFPGEPELFVAYPFVGAQHSRRGRGINGIGRLAPGATLETAREDLMAAYAPLAAAYPQDEGWTAWADPLHDLVARPAHRRSLSLLGGAVALVLLIACLNVANLLLVRAEGRQRELAVRIALGAGGGRLVPHFLSEGLLLGGGGGALGVLVAYGGLAAIRSAFGGMLPRASGIAVDGTALLFALTVSMGCGLVVGMLPVLRLRSVDLLTDLREGSRGVSGAGSTLRKALVVGEISLAVVVLAVAGLLGNSFYRVASVDTGLESPEQVLLVQVALGSGYDDAGARSRFFRELVTRVEALPGVSSAGVTNRLPLFGGTNFTSVPVVGDPERKAGFVEWRMVTPGFFEAVGVRLEEGRLLDASDADADTLRTIVVTRELARQLFPNGRALGERIDLFGDEIGMEVIGVVSDLRDLGHERSAPPGVYAPAGNAVSPAFGYLLVRAASDPLLLVPRVRELVRGMDASLPVFGVRTLDDVVKQRLGGRRFSVSLLGIFAAVALLLGAIGIYGVMSYAVTQRTRELGVRLALGARGTDVQRLVVGQGVRITVLGLAIGLVGAWFSTRLVSSQLFGVEPTDAVTYVAVAVVLGGASLLASWLPARRAARTDPLEALRAE